MVSSPRYRSRFEDELARKTRASSGLRQVEIDEHTLAAAARTSSSHLSITDLAEAIADALKNERRGILLHVNRMIQHAAMKSSTAHDDLRVRNLHKRLFQVEAELWFQPISYRWANNLKPYNADEPRRFVGYYESMASGSAVRIATATRRLPQ